MSGLITNGKFWTTDCIRHPKRRLCCCCPNGLHIDVDFDMFYQTLTKMQRNESTTKQYKHFKRKQDPTIDELLGNRMQPNTNTKDFVMKSRDTPAKASIDVQESLEQALHDFEETLIRSSTSDSRSPLMSPLLTDHFSSSLSLRSDSKSDYLQKAVNGEFGDDTEFQPQSHEIVTSAQQNPKKNHLKDIGINCSTITREIGTECITPMHNTVATETNIVTRDVGTTSIPVIHNNVATNTFLHTKDSETMTNEEKKDCNRFNLDQILNSHIPCKCKTVGTQTMSKITTLQIIEKNDANTQTEEERKLSNSFHECNLKDILNNERVSNRSVATSTQHLLPQSNFKHDKITNSKYSQTKDVIIKEQVLYKNCGTQTNDTKTRFREIGVNTITNELVVVSVDATVQKPDTIQKPILCEKCQNVKTLNAINKDAIQVSKIPRPTNISLNPHSNRKKLLMRQDTYVKLSSTELERLKKEQESSENSGNSRPETSESIQNEKPVSTALFIPSDIRTGESFFQPISENRIKVEPSKEMKAAMKVLNDSLKKPSFLKLKETSLRNAIAVIQQEWFKTSSLSKADPGIIEDYLDAFEEISTDLLEFIVNMRDGAGNTAMHYAVSHGNFDVVSILLDSKVCDINVVNDAGYTCIMLVSLAKLVSNAHCDVIKRVFKLADVNMKAKEHGQTTLMLAASHGKLDIVNLLLEGGADVNIQDDDGSTALMCASEHGYLDIVNVLISHPDCDPSIKDNDGSTALTIAMEANHREIGIALYTRQHFADLNQLSTKEKRSRSANPILMEHRTRTPTSLKSSPSSPSAVV